MNRDASEQDPRSTDGGAPPACREMFCIHSYAGESGPPCGWRGLSREAVIDRFTGTRRCPRCGRTTLLEIPRPA